MHQQLLIQGEPLHYVEAGTGSPVVLLHGSLCDYRYWRWQLKSLSASHRVIVPSLPGYWPALDLHNFKTPVQAERLQNLLNTLLDGEPYHLLGHSRGAQVALQMALTHPLDLRSLMLADPGYFYSVDRTEPTLFNQVLTQLEQGHTDEALALFIDTVNGPSTWRQMVSWFKTMVRDNAPTLRKQVQDSADLRLDIKQLALSCPALLISGQHSPERYKRSIETLKKQLPHAYEITISQAAHGMNLANPNAFNQSLLRFLAATDRNQARSNK